MSKRSFRAAAQQAIAANWTTAKARLHATPSRITPDQLAAIRRQIALAVGIEG